MSTMKQLSSLFRAQLKLAPEINIAECSIENTSAWDSMSHMNLIITLEETFEIVLSGDEIAAMTDYDSLANIIEMKIENR